MFSNLNSSLKQPSDQVIVNKDLQPSEFQEGEEEGPFCCGDSGSLKDGICTLKKVFVCINVVFVSGSSGIFCQTEEGEIFRLFMWQFVATVAISLLFSNG